MLFIVVCCYFGTSSTTKVLSQGNFTTTFLFSGLAAVGLEDVLPSYSMNFPELTIRLQ